ncbi:MAG: hypothetical protein GX811_10185 [Lentisphaerae bacterium]|nr:hypothetical protein [Lentisphaerota bacterium]
MSDFFWTKARLNLVLLIAAGFVLLWHVLRPVYYKWILSKDMVEVVVVCDTTPFREETPEAFVIYDRTALSPLARALGLFQARKPSEVGSFFTLKKDIKSVSSYAVTLQSVPLGPMIRVVFVTGDGGRYMVDVLDRTVRNNKIYVRVQ